MTFRSIGRDINYALMHVVASYVAVLMTFQTKTLSEAQLSGKETQEYVTWYPWRAIVALHYCVNMSWP